MSSTVDSAVTFDVKTDMSLVDGVFVVTCVSIDGESSTSVDLDVSFNVNVNISLAVGVFVVNCMLADG